MITNHYDEQCDEFEDTGCPSQLEMLTAATHRYLTISLMSIHLYVKIYNQGCILVHYSHQPWVTYSSEATQHTHNLTVRAKSDLLQLLGLHLPSDSVLPSSLYSFDKASSMSTSSALSIVRYQYCPHCFTMITDAALMNIVASAWEPGIVLHIVSCWTNQNTCVT